MTSRTISDITAIVDINSDKLVLNAMTVLLGNHTYAIDTTGETNVVRPQTTRSLAENIRRVLVKNSNNTISVNTTCGVMVQAITALNPSTATAADIVNAVRNAITSSNGFGIKIDPPAQAGSSSLKEILGQITVIDTDGEMAINDTKETTLQSVEPQTSVLLMIRNLTGGNDGNIRLNTTSGRKIAALETQDPDTATTTTIITAMREAL